MHDNPEPFMPESSAAVGRWNLVDVRQRIADPCRTAALFGGLAFQFPVQRKQADGPLVGSEQRRPLLREILGTGAHGATNGSAEARRPAVASFVCGQILFLTFGHPN